ncbi:RNA-guided endonuclease TnpB family protein [Borreliella garinii]|uniref:RNA-guided endonuclease TnpB family protein n=1 Tax=Borreliella garinii TaxID=29519 RepID=UPI001AEF6F8F|nr:RNA-guided endonuclease TnpB family protein [Borreliella garinii]
MSANKAYKYRIYPNTNQKKYFSKAFGCVRFLYNKMLSDKKDYYEKNKKNLSVNPSNYKNEFPFLKEVDSLALCSAWIDLNSAYSNFFREIKKGNRTQGFPKYKSKKNRQTYRTNNQKNSIRIENDYIKIPKIGFVKLALHRNIKSNEVIKNVVVEKDTDDKYYISVTVECLDVKNNDKTKDNKKEVVGIDMSMRHFLVSSEGEKINHPKYLLKNESKLKRYQKKQKGSRNRAKSRLRVARLHRKISNQRKDFLHKLSYYFAANYKNIVIENLSIKGMQKGMFGKSVNDLGWYEFLRQLSYKSEWYGFYLHKADRYFPSSKLCNNCSIKNTTLKLSDTRWTCSGCNTLHDRDINAALNLKNYYKEIKTKAGTA